MDSCKVVSFEAGAFLVPMRRMGMQLRMRRIPSPNSLRSVFLDYLGPATQARMGSHAAHGNQTSTVYQPCHENQRKSGAES
jgi:hypothetical protein